jgi:hypothetical protein
MTFYLHYFCHRLLEPVHTNHSKRMSTSESTGVHRLGPEIHLHTMPAGHLCGVLNASSELWKWESGLYSNGAK